MDERVLGRLAEWWASASSRGHEAAALAALCVHFAHVSGRPAAVFLAGHALDLDGANLAALQCLEALAEYLGPAELCRRYETFLAEASVRHEAGLAAPSEETLSLVRNRLVRVLFGLGHTYSALRHVDAELEQLAAGGPGQAEFDRACAALAREVERERAYAARRATYALPDQLAQLDYDLACCAQRAYAEAAE